MILLRLFNNKHSKKSVELPAEINSAKAAKRLIVLTGETKSPSEYIQNLIDQLRDDIFPLFALPGGAPFAIARNTFCYIDHVSTLLYGKKGTETSRMKKVLNDFAGYDSISNGKYKRYSAYLVQHYRHDLVHNVRPLPKILKVKNDGKITEELSWFFVFSKTENGMSFDQSVINFKDLKFRSGFAHLRYTGNQIAINTNCMFFDTIIFLNNLIERLDEDTGLQKKIVKNYYGIIEKNLTKVDSILIDKDSEEELTKVFDNI